MLVFPEISVKFNNIRMIAVPQYVFLGLQQFLDFGHLLKFGLAHHLDRILLSTIQAGCLIYVAPIALPDHIHYLHIVLFVYSACKIC